MVDAGGRRYPFLRFVIFQYGGQMVDGYNRATVVSDRPPHPSNLNVDSAHGSCRISTVRAGTLVDIVRAVNINNQG